MLLSIVLPCYNESENIPELWESYSTSLSARTDVEVLFINNGSTDASGRILEYLMENRNEKGIFKVISVAVNHGYGYGIMAGLREAIGDVLAWTHADLQTDPLDVLVGYDKFIECQSKLIFIKGKREKRKFHAWIFSYGMQLVSSWVLNKTMKEINAQPKIFSRFFYEEYLKDNAPYDFSLDLFACYHAARNAVIKEIPVRIRNRRFGEAKGGGSVKTKMKLIYRTWNYIFRLRKELFMQGIIGKRR